jgi:hypothetical protein
LDGAMLESKSLMMRLCECWHVLRGACRKWVVKISPVPSSKAEKSIEEDSVAQSERYQIPKRITLAIVDNEQLTYPVIICVFD